MGKEISKQANDLLTVFPDLAAEWDFQRNSPLEPNHVASKSGKHVFWLCPAGHSYLSKVNNRANGKGCPYCSGHKVLAGFNDLATVNPKLADEWDYSKNEPVTPLEISAGSSRKFYWCCEAGHSFEASVGNRSIGRGCPYCSGRKATTGQTDLATLNPELASEWDYSKNSPLTPADVKPGTNKKVHWICPKGHSFASAISSRSSGNGCPVCANKKIVSGVNDLATVHPELERQWDFKSNYPLTPSEVSPGSNIKVFWLCEEGHTFQSAINNRTSKATGCPYCSGQKVIAGVSDLATTHPLIAQEWDFSRNDSLTPQQVSFGSNQKPFWKCSSGHSFQSSISNRCRLNRGCPYCAGQKVIEGITDLATTNPDLAAEWDIDKNSPLLPKDVMAGSQKKIFWLCSNGHSFWATINSRNAGSSCPYCSGLLAIPGVNDLETTHPNLIKEWDFEKNSGITPCEVKAGSGKRVYWICPVGHSYKSVIGSRADGDGCPVCYNRQVLAGFNDLATTHPLLANEWDYARNQQLIPQMVISGTHQKVNWLCPEGHSYVAVVKDRSQGTGCPICGGQKVLAGYNDLATSHPELVADWDFEKNPTLTPQQVSSGSNQKVYWRCSEGHSYLSIIASRTNGTGCPRCANYGYDQTQAGLFYYIKSEVLLARKIGITNPHRRYDRIASYGADWDVVKTYTHNDGKIIRELETRLLKWLRSDLQIPAYLGKEDMGKAGGHSETFSLEGPTDFEVIQKVEMELQNLVEKYSG